MNGGDAGGVESLETLHGIERLEFSWALGIGPRIGSYGVGMHCVFSFSLYGLGT